MAVDELDFRAGEVWCGWYDVQVLELNVANDGVAFRYVIPRSTPLDEILIDDELTEFSLPAYGAGDSKARLPLPFIAASPIAGWIVIAESKPGKYPAAYLEPAAESILLTRLAAPFEGASPLTCPWRIVIVGASRERLMDAEILRVR